MDAGNFTVMARMVRDAIKSRPFGTVMTYMTDLASGVSDERARKIREQVPGALLGNAINFPFDDPDFQAVWAAPDLGPQFRAPIKSDVPVLFISGTLDGRTSLGDAEEVRRGFSHNAHIIVAGASHNPYALTTGLRDAMLRFARGEAVRDMTLQAPAVELRGPDETLIVDDLRAAAKDGPDTAAQRLRAMAKPGSGRHVTSLIINDFVLAATRQDRALASAVVGAGLELFPKSSQLLTRRAELEAAAGNKSQAIASYRVAVDADPFNQVAAVQLRKLLESP
jgi:hypothetical protein